MVLNNSLFLAIRGVQVVWWPKRSREVLKCNQIQLQSQKPRILSWTGNHFLPDQRTTHIHMLYHLLHYGDCRWQKFDQLDLLDNCWCLSNGIHVSFERRSSPHRYDSSEGYLELINLLLSLGPRFNNNFLVPSSSRDWAVYKFQRVLLWLGSWDCWDDWLRNLYNQNLGKVFDVHAVLCYRSGCQ